MPKTRTIFVVCKNNLMTRLMQDADMFEPFKFIGMTFRATQKASHHHLTPEELLKRFEKKDSKHHTVVGVMIPNVGSAFLPNYRVYSTGTDWMTVEQLCEMYLAPLTEECSA